MESEAIDFLKNHSEIDVIVLDFFMPKMDGLQTLDWVMKCNPTPAIMITIAKIRKRKFIFQSASIRRI